MIARAPPHARELCGRISAVSDVSPVLLSPYRGFSCFWFQHMFVMRNLGKRVIVYLSRVVSLARSLARPLIYMAMM